MKRKRGQIELRVALVAMWIDPRRDAGMVRPLLDLYLDLYAVQDDMVSEYQSLEAIATRLGRTAVPPLLKIFATGSPDERWAALDMLRMVGERGDKDIIEAAESVLNADDERLRVTAAFTLSGVATDSEVAQLAKLLGPMSPHNHSVVIKLGEIGSMEAVMVLVDLLYQEDRTRTTPYVLNALEYIGTDAARRALDNWRVSDTRKAYVERLAKETLGGYLVFRPYQGWVEAVFDPPGSEPPSEERALYRDSTIVAISKALRHPRISAWVAKDLERSGNPHALAILKLWQDENQKG